MTIANTGVFNLRSDLPALTDPVYIGRGTIWGNPYVIGKDGDRAAVLLKYRRALWNNKNLLKRVPELRGKQLLCFCAPEMCHGHVLMAAIAWHEREAAKAAGDAKLAEVSQRAAVAAKKRAETAAKRRAATIARRADRLAAEQAPSPTP